MNIETYDIIVIGGGHAGCEAALAGARLGAKVLLITMRRDTIGAMSCNPAIGGLAKGQLVREIDALGGEMGRATDATMIQFRLLNMKKGPAVRSSRAQVDRHAYAAYMRRAVEGTAGCEVREGLAETILTDGDGASGVTTSSGETYRAKAVIVTTGTFLNGLIHIGLEHTPGGRMGEAHSVGLSASLKALGIGMGRLKTGTCARLDGRTIDFARLAAQESDVDIRPFSSRTSQIARAMVPCHITYTNQTTHDIIRSGFNRSPLFTGIIKGTGVRYCPSIEDKIFRFPDRDRHHIFIEPEGLSTNEYYPNGISTSLPIDIQERLIHSIEGLERAVIVRPGYGIEYDYADPTQLYPTLETKAIGGLYLAGQINGTTGYEEAASLGLMAGINAARRVQGKEPVILKRSEAYIGVLIDDLVTKGTSEPYRMFTSRVEYRLVLREDNADTRLTPVGHTIGLVDNATFTAVMEKKGRVAREIARLGTTRRGKVLRRPGVTYDEAVKPIGAGNLSAREREAVEISVKYEGFIERQASEIARFEKIERIKLRDDIDYAAIHSLSSEIKEKLSRIRPRTLGQASRISGVTPAAISILMVYLEKRRREAL